MFLLQTLLETIKRQFAVDYKGIPFEKIHPTVGMNGGYFSISYHVISQLNNTHLKGQGSLDIKTMIPANI